MPEEWYEVTEDLNLEQGDILRDCPVFFPYAQFATVGQPEEQIDFEYRNYDVVVLTQSCDIQARKIDTIVLCPLFEHEEIKQMDQHYLKSRKGMEEARRGYLPPWALLNSCGITGFERDVSVVNFRQIYTLPLEYVEGIVHENPKRLRLIPPYREHLSQAFARFFMRVGLPADIPNFK